MISRGHALRRAIQTAKNWPKQPDNEYRHKELASGWLLPCLLEADLITHGRWHHWVKTAEAGRMIDEPIPPVHWENGAPVRRMMEKSLDAVGRGSWQGWSSWKTMDYFLDWLLFGLGHHKEAPKELDEGTSSRLYQVFCLESMLAFPHDYFGDLLAETAHGQRNGFYPTPMCVSEFMAQMQMAGAGEDLRDKTVMDPCLGTGRLLLCAAAFSYRLYGMDIDQTVIKAALINGYLYAPWLVKPFGFWTNEPEGKTETVSVSVAKLPAKAGQLEFLL